MKVVGIVAEFDPFHNGHQYLCSEAVRLAEADFSVAIMSGNFCERGEPAIVDKYTRTRMALLGGIDLVLELPPIYATASAGEFALGALRIMKKLKVITHIAFGCEDDCKEAYLFLAKLLSEEPEELSILLRQSMADGLSYPKAREHAVIRYVEEYLPLSECKDYTADNIHVILGKPNNTLVLEYLIAMNKLQMTNLTPIFVKRMGPEHNSEQIYENHYASGSALRSMLCEPNATWQSFLPSESVRALDDALQHSGALYPEDFYPALQYALWSGADSLTTFWGVSRELNDRIHNLLKNHDGNMDTFIQDCKTKNNTLTAVNRALLHILLGITKEEHDLHKDCDYPALLYVLGFRKESSELLHEIDTHADMPLITKLGPYLDQYHNTLGSEAYASQSPEECKALRLQFNTLIRTSNLYYLQVSQKYHCKLNTEESRKLVIL